jgi:RNA polymerase sigma factor (sigma-70 family)
VSRVSRPDAELVARCRAGDSDAFEALYREHSPRLYALARRMTGSSPESEDLLQDIFLQVHRKLDSYRGDAALGTWLYRLAIRQCLDFLRSRHGRMRAASRPLEDEGPLVPSDRSRARDRAAPAGLPNRVRAARRRGSRAQADCRDARGKREHFEKPGVQSAHEAARDVAIAI